MPAQRHPQSQSQPAQSAIRDDHIDPNIQGVPRQQEHEQFQKQYEQHVQPQSLHSAPIPSPAEAENPQEHRKQTTSEHFEDAPMTVGPDQLAKPPQGASRDERNPAP